MRLAVFELEQLQNFNIITFSVQIKGAYSSQILVLDPHKILANVQFTK